MRRTIVSFIFVLLLSSLSMGEVVIYEDDFSGDGAVNLHGLAPDVDNYGGGNTWIAHSGWKADGTPGPYSSATLPFTPAVGRVYVLLARFTDVVGDNDWLAAGFAAGSSINSGDNDDRFISGDTAGQPWMLRRGDDATEDDQTFAGPGTANSQDFDTLDRASDVDFAIVLHTRLAQWEAMWFQKLTSEPESEYSLVRYFTYSNNPSIGAVGLACANDGTTGNIDYFFLGDFTDEEPPDDNDLVAHWTLNEADYDGRYLDTVAGLIAQPTGEPNFITGVRDEPNGAVMVTPSSGWGLSEAFDFGITGGFTICFWVDWNGDWEETINVDDLVVESRQSGAEYVVTNGLKADQRWQHVCVTYEDGWLKVYLNGLLKITESCEMPDVHETAIAIGNDGEQQIFNGDIDDIRLYDYALSQTEITQLATGDENCIQQYSLEYDFSGPYDLPDCAVNFYDLAEFSKHWLESSLEYDFSGPGGLPDSIVNLYDLAEFTKHWLSSGW